MKRSRIAILIMQFLIIMLGLASKDDTIMYLSLAIVPMFGMSLAYHMWSMK